ncbi:PHD finger protein ALFIN-LIKE 9-like [Impatiens glandulifera]|uniref:PHD finger protein ALFIN-LIKE 9-like n=1 Tax=Impatiens glandulifera TaxID=253017 RepID=UPI001FB0A084|nr:PHD finger protein ALFIN-LIKE 9-like [Impatiens glandulifera]
MADKENLCLYGLPNEQWEVNLPAEEVPPELPESVLGINFVRDGMQENDWLSLVSAHSDAWLLSIAYYFGARFGFDKSDSTQSCHLKHILHVLQVSLCLLHLYLS